MKAILTRLTFRREFGLAIGDREIAASEVATTLFGRYEVARTSMAYEPDGLAAALEKMLSSWSSGKAIVRSRVVIGLPTLRIFFSTRSIQAKNHEASPLALLHEVIQSPSVNIDDMAVDLIKPRAGRRPLASIISCRKKYLAGIMSALESSGVEAGRAEPAPCALLRLAALRHKPPRKSHSFVRVFLGPNQGLAVLAAGFDLPLMWRPFALPEGEESAAILAAVASVRILGTYCGLRSDIDAVLVHGRPDLGNLAALGTSSVLKAIRFLRHDTPSMVERDVALGLAFAPAHGVESFNLLRSLVGRARFRDIFPWRQVIAQALLLVAASFFLQKQLASHRVADSAVRAGDAKHPWATKFPIAKLQTQKKDLEDRIDAIRSFLGERVLWTANSRALAEHLTTEMALSSIVGSFELDSPGAKSANRKRSLVLQLEAPIPRTGTMPPEIDAFLRDLRADPRLTHDFPEIDLSDLRWKQNTSKTANATFSVICRPKKITAPPKIGAGVGQSKTGAGTKAKGP